MGVLASNTFKPTLFLGLGGNGGKIVNLLAERLRRHPHWSRISSMTHFLAIDTNKDDLDKLRAIPAETRFLISAFDARSYVERKKGERELAEDPLVTQWIPDDYAFRSTQGSGAGQIRMESRLRLYYNLEEDRAGIRQRIKQLLHESTSREDPWRDNEDKVVRVIVYGSVAGGTGSGGFLPMAYLLRDMILDAGWGRPNLTAILSLPTTFLDKVKPQLHNDIKANGYAALKELEYLTRQLDYPGGLDELRFHYDPGALDQKRHFVRERPFNLVYLVDRPDGVSIEKYEHAVADASYLQIFSPLLGHQAGEYDNYEKRQKSLALGHFSVHYGAYGTALLHLPRKDLLRYASLRYVARALREFLSFGGDHPDFRVPYGQASFERLAPEEKNRIIDERFKGYVATRAAEEAKQDERGVFTSILSQQGAGGKPLRQAFAARLAAIYGKLDELIDIPDVEAQSISPGNPSVSRPIAVMREAYAKSRARVRGEHLESQLSELRSGRLFTSFFNENQVNPIAQRLFLQSLMDEPFITPFENALDGGHLAEEIAPPNLDSQEVKEELDRLGLALSRSANQKLLGRLFDSENKAFLAAKVRAVRQLNTLSDELRDDLRRFFWKTYEAELRKVAESMLGAFRKVSELADDAARAAETETERFRRDPGAFPDSDVAQFYLDAEVLRDDRRRERLWNCLFEHLLNKGAYFDTARIFDSTTSAFQPSRDQDGQVRSPDASEILARVRTSLLDLSGEVYAQALRDAGLNLQTGLELEQRYIALLDDGHDFDDLREKGMLEDTIRAVPAERVRRGIEDRFKRLADECVLLAHIDRTKGDDPTVTPASVFYAGLGSAFSSDEADSLRSMLRSVVGGVGFVDGWESEDSLVLYRALLGVPLYWFRNIQTELYPAYRRVMSDPGRSYPLHIEAAWDKAPGLPNLDPEEMKRAEEAAQRERKALEARLALEGRIRTFAICNLFGTVGRDESGYAWTYGDLRQSLGKDRSAAFSAFEALDPTLRNDLIQAATSTWEGSLTSRADREKLLAQVRAHGEQLKNLYMQAVTESRDAEKRLLEDERKILDHLASELEAKA